MLPCVCLLVCLALDFVGLRASSGFFLQPVVNLYGKTYKTYAELVLIGTWTMYVLIMHQDISFYLQKPHSIIDVNAG